MNRGAQIVTDFVSALRKAQGLTVNRSAVSQNVFEVGGPVQCLLYVKGRAEAPYRWGVTANVVEQLKQQKLRWFTVLLYESKDTGYLLSSADVLYYIKNVWPLAGDGDYKPATGTYLSRNAPFASISEFTGLLAAEAS